jgi:hypothetical protein
MSVTGSVPTTSAGNRAPSEKITEILSAFPMTWLFVMM